MRPKFNYTLLWQPQTSIKPCYQYPLETPFPQIFTPCKNIPLWLSGLIMMFIKTWNLVSVETKYWHLIIAVIDWKFLITMKATTLYLYRVWVPKVRGFQWGINDKDWPRLVVATGSKCQIFGLNWNQISSFFNLFNSY